MEKILTTEELQSLKNLNERYVNLTYQLGEIEFDIKKYQDILVELNLQKDYLFKDFKSLKESEQNLTSTLFTKYGEGKIDLESGKIS